MLPELSLELVPGVTSGGAGQVGSPAPFHSGLEQKGPRGGGSSPLFRAGAFRTASPRSQEEGGSPIDLPLACWPCSSW